MTFGGGLQELERGQPGTLHLTLEPHGREALSGVYLDIAASTSFLQAHFDGQPLWQFSSQKSILARVLGFLGVRPRRWARLYDCTQQQDDNRPT